MSCLKLFRIKIFSDKLGKGVTLKQLHKLLLFSIRSALGKLFKSGFKVQGRLPTYNFLKVLYIICQNNFFWIYSGLKLCFLANLNKISSVVFALALWVHTIMTTKTKSYMHAVTDKYFLYFWTLLGSGDLKTNASV